MAGGEKDRILQLRNQTSLKLDDLAALVVNSALFLDLRFFSEEIMELKPGFAFTLKQAEALKNLTEKVFSQYKKKAVGDSGLMNYLADAKSILRDEAKANGGGQMSFLTDLFHRGEIRKKEEQAKLERDYKALWGEILSCEREMAQCITESKGCAPDSMVYRSNERKYSIAKKKLALLRKQEKQMNDVIEQTTLINLIEEYGKVERELANKTGILFGSDESREKALATAETDENKVNQGISAVRDYGGSLFESPEEETARPSSEFSAKVAASERRDAMMETSGEAEPEGETAGGSSEFDRLVNGSDTKE